jgi:integrase
MYKRRDSWYSDFVYQGQRYVKSWGPVSKTVAKEKDRKLRTEVAEGKFQRRGENPPFPKLMDRYLEWSQVNKRPGSYQRDLASTKHLKAAFGKRRLDGITAWAVEHYKKERREAGGMPATVNRELACLRHMLNKAVEWGLARENPMRGVKLFREDNQRTRILSEEEEARLLAACQESRSWRLRLVILTALHTGMRKGEILSLKKEDVDFQARYITVGQTKNGHGRRIPLNATLKGALLEAVRQSRSEYVFGGEDGRPVVNIKRGWQAALKRAGIDGVTFHTCRHTFGTRLVMRRGPRDGRRADGAPDVEDDAAL